MAPACVLAPNPMWGRKVALHPRQSPAIAYQGEIGLNGGFGHFTAEYKGRTPETDFSTPKSKKKIDFFGKNQFPHHFKVSFLPHPRLN